MIRWRRRLFWIGFFPAPAWAAEAASSLGRVAAALFMVLAMLLLGAWLWRRVTGLQGGGGGGLRIEASLAIGSRERLLVVRAGQRRLLLGVSPAGIVRLAALGSEDWPPPPLEGEVSFARLLAARLRREGRE